MQMSRISRTFFSNFCKSVFSIFTYSEYRKLGFKNSRCSNICLVNIENSDFKNPRFSTSVFSIFTIGEYQKHGFMKVGFFFSNFYKSVFSRFTYSEYRKHGCLKIWDFKHLSSEYRKLRFQKIRDFQTSVFSIFTCSEYRKDGCLKISNVLKSKFSTFTVREYRKHGFIKHDLATNLANCCKSYRLSAFLGQVLSDGHPSTYLYKCNALL